MWIHLVLHQANHWIIIKTYSHNIIPLIIHKPKPIIKNNIIPLTIKMSVKIVIIMAINMYIAIIIILHIKNLDITIILNKHMVNTINNIKTLTMYLITNTTIYKNLINLLKINLLTRSLTIYKNKNNKKFITCHNFNLLTLFIQVIKINLKISLKDYKHQKLLMKILKTTKYLIFQ